eukprot:Rmarinus@m.29897
MMRLLVFLAFCFLGAFAFEPITPGILLESSYGDWDIENYSQCTAPQCGPMACPPKTLLVKKYDGNGCPICPLCETEDGIEVTPIDPAMRIPNSRSLNPSSCPVIRCPTPPTECPPGMQLERAHIGNTNCHGCLACFPVPTKNPRRGVDIAAEEAFINSLSEEERHALLRSRESR